MAPKMGTAIALVNVRNYLLCVAKERREKGRVGWKQSIRLRAGRDDLQMCGVDLSDSGMAVVGAELPPGSVFPGERVLLSFRVDGLPIVVQGETVNLMKEGELIRAGIRFVQLSPTQRALLMRIMKRAPTGSAT